ncbi:hypothetical protein Tco_0728337 [Tanacetum coccineum]|uniref:Uncharacterized protein n=1 Tax=Tanacetum coccineum TaxID=301880 RepID=A0ABQ4YLV5_9ASTR
MVPRAVLMKSGLVSVNTARQVNTAHSKTTVNAARPMYLKGQPKLSLWYPKDSPFDLAAYTDSDYAKASLDRKRLHKEAIVKVKTVNGEVQLHALVDGKKIIINESTVRRDLQLEDAKAHTKDEANVAFIEELDDIQAKIEADHELAQRLQAEEQEGESYAKEKRNKPPTQAQQRKIMCTYLKNMEGKKPKELKNKSFDSIQKMFDRSFKRENTFVDFRTDLVEGSSKRAREELEQESTKKQKVDEDKDTTEL